MHPAFLLLRNVLHSLYDTEEARAIARLVLEQAFLFTPAELYGAKERPLTSGEERQLQEIARRLQGGEPVQYVVGRASFCGLELRVSPAVLIPRPETEDLVAWVVEDCAGLPPLRLLDVGTGSGAIAIALSKALPACTAEAWDISEEALRVARANAQEQQAAVDFRLRDMHAATEVAADIVVSNPPYVRESEAPTMENHVKAHEPPTALFVPDDDPLIHYRRLASLAAGRRLYVELNAALSVPTAQLLHASGFSHVDIRLDRYARPRMARAF